VRSKTHTPEKNCEIEDEEEVPSSIIQARLLSAGCLTLFGMPDKMDKLLAVIAEFGDEEDVLIQFRDASW
jgi:hypothetical protein